MRERVGEGGREWESGIVRVRKVRKPLRTAKEPALVMTVSPKRGYSHTCRVQIHVLLLQKYENNFTQSSNIDYPTATYFMFVLCTASASYGCM